MQHVWLCYFIDKTMNKMCLKIKHCLNSSCGQSRRQAKLCQFGDDGYYAKDRKWMFVS